MNNNNGFKYSIGVIAYPMVFILIIWLVFWIEVRFGFNFTKYGVYPLRLKGLRGILLSPFIHGSLAHLYHNTIPLFVLSVALFYFYKPIAWKVIVFGIVISGLFTWYIGRPSYHIGASGLIYVLISFIFFKGVFAKYYRLIALSLLVVFLYGSMIWYTLPIEDGISWEGHLGGFLTGLFFALVFKKNIAKPKKYNWQHAYFNEADDPFLKHFDENGNFIELPEPDVDEQQPFVNYDYKIKEK